MQTGPTIGDTSLAQRIIEALLKDKTRPSKDIAAELGCCSATVRYHRKRLHGIEVALHDMQSWRKVKFGTDVYLVSAEGDVWNLRHGRFMAHARQNAYIVAEAYLPPPSSPNLILLHRNDITSDNRPDNLYWGTDADNARDRARNKCGSLEHCRAKRAHHLAMKKRYGHLTPGRQIGATAAKVLEMSKHGASVATMAERVGCGRANILAHLRNLRGRK